MCHFLTAHRHLTGTTVPPPWTPYNEGVVLPFAPKDVDPVKAACRSNCIGFRREAASPRHAKMLL